MAHELGQLGALSLNKWKLSGNHERINTAGSYLALTHYLRHSCFVSVQLSEVSGEIEGSDSIDLAFHRNHST